MTVDDLPGVVDEWEPNTDRVAGVTVSVPARPDWSRAFLERRIGCYRRLAQPNPDDLLLVADSSIRVTENQGRFDLTISSEDPAVAQRIVAASRQLLAPAATRVTAAR